MTPSTCYFYITYRCMARCSFCNIWQLRSEELSFEQRVQLLREVRALGARYVDLTGGETLLYDRLPDLLVEAKKLGCITSLTTNSVLYPQRHKELLGLTDIFGFSINGATRETHDKFYGLPCFDKVIESITLARRAKEPAYLHTTATEANIEELPRIVELARELDVPLILFTEFAYYGNSGLAQQYLDTVLECARRPRVYLNMASLRIARQGGNHTHRPICRGLGAAFALTPEGHLTVPCFHKRQETIPVLGRLASVFHSETVQRKGIQEAGRAAYCEGCMNWCYINPSIMRPNLLGFLNVWSTLRRYRGIHAGNDGLYRPTADIVRRYMIRAPKDRPVGKPG